MDGIPARINALTERIEEQLWPLQPAITRLSSISGIGTRQGQVIRTAIGLYVDGVVAQRNADPPDHHAVCSPQPHSNHAARAISAADPDADSAPVVAKPVAASSPGIASLRS